MLLERSDARLANRVHRVAPQVWIREGANMALQEDDAVFDSIELKHSAEEAEHRVLAEEIRIRGQLVLEARNKLQDKLTAIAFDYGMYLKAMAQGKIDLALMLAFGLVNVLLVWFSLAAFGPTWLAVLLAFAVLGSSLAVDRFFRAKKKRDVLQQGLFIILGFLCFAAQFLLGGMRGLLLAATAPGAVGRVSEFFIHAGPVLQFALGVFAFASEFLCGFEFYKATTQLFSEGACTTRELSRCGQALATFGSELETAKVEAGIRQHYRTIGARQCLASREKEQRRFEKRHTLRALGGALIAILIILVLLFLAPNVFGASATGMVNVVLLDLSKSESKESYVANLAAVPEIIEKLSVGDRIVVVGTGNDFGTTKMLFDQTLPTSAGFMGLQLAMAREEVSVKWQTAAHHPSAQRRFDQTDILGAIRFISHLGIPLTAQTRLIVLSDMRQSSRETDIEHVSVVNVDATLAKVKKAQGIVAFPGVAVHLIAVESEGTTEQYYTTLKEFWTKFFTEARAHLKTYSVSRTIPELK